MAPGDASTPAGRSLGEGVFVRPFGYRPPDPIVRQIGDRDLFLGNAAAGGDRDDGSDDGRRFEYVLSLTDELTPLTTHHCPLVDGAENDWCDFERAVDTARGLFRRDGSVLVHCEHGISRSSAVLATTIAAENGISFRAALSAVQRARPRPSPTHGSTSRQWCISRVALDMATPAAPDPRSSTRRRGEAKRLTAPITQG